MCKHVEKYVKSCHTCWVSKTQTIKPSGLLQPLLVPDHPWTHITMDLIVNLPRTERQNDAITIFVNLFSKATYCSISGYKVYVWISKWWEQKKCVVLFHSVCYSFFYSECRLVMLYVQSTKNAHYIYGNSAPWHTHFIICCSSCSDPDLANLFFKNVINLHGLPLLIVSNLNPQFCSQFWTYLFSWLCTQLDMLTAYHQQMDGQSERTIQMLKQYLCVFIIPFVIWYCSAARTKHAGAQ